jgi:hypothetical protein
MPRYYFFGTLLLLSCGYAFYRGRKYERLVAAICLIATFSSVALHAPPNQRYVGIEHGDLLVDSLVLIAFVVIALRSDRFWPLWVAGLQLTMNVAHLLKAIDPSLMPAAYEAAERFWSYPILVILAVGTLRAHRRATREYPGPREPSPA